MKVSNFEGTGEEFFKQPLMDIINSEWFVKLERINKSNDPVFISKEMYFEVTVRGIRDGRGYQFFGIRAPFEHFVRYIKIS